jgi:hypothetical protein
MTTWNPSDKSAGIALSGGNLVATQSMTSTGGVRGTTSNSSGKWYFECTATLVKGTSYRIGIVNSSWPETSGLGGSTAGGAQEATNGHFLIGGTTIGTAAGYTTGNVVGVAIDFTNKLIWYATNGGNWNNSGTANPTTGAGGFSLSTLAAGPYFIGFGSGFTTTGNAVTLDPTGSAFGPPGGFSSWDSAGASLSATGRVSTCGAASGSYSTPLLARGRAATQGRESGAYSAVLSAHASATTSGRASSNPAAALKARSATILSGRPSPGATIVQLFVRGSAGLRGGALGGYAAVLTTHGVSAVRGRLGLAPARAPFDPDYALLAPLPTEIFVAPQRDDELLATSLIESLLAE